MAGERMEFSRPGRACRRRPPTLRDATLAIGLGPWGYGPRGIAPWGSAATIVSRPTRRQPRAGTKPRRLPAPNAPTAGLGMTIFAQEVSFRPTRRGRGRWPANGKRISRRRAERSEAKPVGWMRVLGASCIFQLPICGV
jgi:hypothetical protein